MASRLTGDLESFKHSHSSQASPSNGNLFEIFKNIIFLVYANSSTLLQSDKTWGSRRMNKQAKYGRFEAQQQLEAEICAKHQALDELRSIRARCDETEKELFEAKQKVIN